MDASCARSSEHSTKTEKISKSKRTSDVSPMSKGCALTPSPTMDDMYKSLGGQLYLPWCSMMNSLPWRTKTTDSKGDLSDGSRIKWGSTRIGPVVDAECSFGPRPENATPITGSTCGQELGSSMSKDSSWNASWSLPSIQPWDCNTRGFRQPAPSQGQTYGVSRLAGSASWKNCTAWPCRKALGPSLLQLRRGEREWSPSLLAPI
mmetsp:Transcript_38350/g.110835  ORF Transcript_38350/g.110835 Transcript_38350/m.110835 type:complete len:205 (+) Transcript_38350:1140-1754(+)